jgi:hypothetical protein
MAHTMDDGRVQQFEEMMEALTGLQAKYSGVRGQLLAKVRDEFMRLKPGAKAAVAPVAVAAAKPVAVAAAKPAPVAAAKAAVPAAKPSPTSHMLPSCRACGRSMREAGNGSLVCQNGHTRLLAG